MLNAMALMIFLAEAPATTTLPRHPDPDPVTQQSSRPGEPTDPWFDREHGATDDAAFILGAVESARQGAVDARSAAGGLKNPQLRDAASRIQKLNETTARQLEQLAGTKGWRLPEDNPGRTSTLPGADTPRANANFILSQISYHENTIEQYRAQLSGSGDPQLKRTLKGAVSGYQKNLDLLLTLKP